MSSFMSTTGVSSKFERLYNSFSGITPITVSSPLIEANISFEDEVLRLIILATKNSFAVTYDSPVLNSIASLRKSLILSSKLYLASNPCLLGVIGLMIS